MESPTPSSAASCDQDEEERRTALKKCFAAIDARDIDQFKAPFQSGQLTSWDHIGPLQSTIRAGWLDGTRFLLAEQGADVANIRVDTTLKDVGSLDMFKLLAEFGLDFGSKGSELLGEVVEQPEIFDWLLDQGVDINSGKDRRRHRLKRGERDSTCGVLNEAAARGNVDVFERLVARGADPSRSIALHMASLCKDPDKTVAMMNHLVEKHKFDINAHDDAGRLLDLMTPHPEDGPPLNYAITYRNTAAIEFLLRHGVRPTDAAFNLAITSNAEPALKLFLDAGLDSSNALTDIPSGDHDNQDLRLKAAKLCLERGGDPTPAILLDEELVSNDRFEYHGMSEEMRKLLDEWKTKWKAEGKESDLSKVNKMIADLRGS